MKPESLKDKKGAAIRRIWFGDGNSMGAGETSGGHNRTMELGVDFCGDRHEFYVLHFEDGIEVARHNIRYIASIEWEQPKMRPAA